MSSFAIHRAGDGGSPSPKLGLLEDNCGLSLERPSAAARLTGRWPSGWQIRCWGNGLFRHRISGSLTTIMRPWVSKSLRQGCTLLATYKCTLRLFLTKGAVGGKRTLELGGS